MLSKPTPFAGSHPWRAAGFIRTALELKSASESMIVERYPEIARVLTHMRPLSAAQVMENIVDLHRRHGDEVSRVMNTAFQEHATEFLAGLLPPTCAIILAIPDNYWKPKGEKDTVGPPRGPNSGNKTDNRKTPLSKKDADVFAAIGERHFHNLTNAEITNRFRSQLMPLFKKFSPNSIRSRLNRIRRHHHLPMSNHLKNAVNG
jgi:hypothetical protein